MQGIIYIMTTTVSGLVKIGKIGTDNYIKQYERPNKHQSHSKRF